MISGFVIAAAVSIYAADLFWGCPSALPESPVILVIEPGMTPLLIAEKLQEEGVVQSAGALVLASRLMFVDREFQAGRYHFQGGKNNLAVLARLRQGGTAQELVTIPEGLRAHQIASIVRREANVDSAGFMTLISDSSFIAGVLPREEGETFPVHLDGYLLPDTYNIYYQMPAEDVLRLMVGQFVDLWKRELGGAAARFRLSRHEVVTLASIVEREAATSGERPLISAVFHNRLRRGMRLESCATVLYALGRYKRRLYEKDLEIDSPYNTYKIRGLPPGPIANAGAASLRAVVSPAETDYLYFVARGDGTHAFSRTYTEHLRAKQAEGSGVLVGGRAVRNAEGLSTVPPQVPPSNPPD